MSEENSTAFQVSDTGAESSQEVSSNQEKDNEGLYRALKAEREARKQYEKQVKEQAAMLARFEETNPDEVKSLREEAAKAAQLQAQFGEAREAIELKYSKEAEAARQSEANAKANLAEFRKKYALEKVFLAAGGKTDSADGISFYDMLANQISSSFRQEEDGSLTVVDAAGDPILDKESGKRIDPLDYVASFKVHPVYGTFFKGAKGAGAGIGYGGTDANGMPVEDLTGLSRDELFRRAFGN
jgi:flagellar biosynthesis GTPase FlhF